MHFETHSYTNMGGSVPNEDAAGYCGDDSRCLWVLCDGLGGHVAGEAASNLAVNEMLEAFSSGIPASPADLAPAIERVNGKVRALGGPLTTIVTAFQSGGVLSVANVGDSRLYFFRGGRLASVTTDHSVAFADYCMQKVKYPDIRFHLERSSLMKALGVKEPVGVQCYPSFPLFPGDAFLLCSDGFWEYVFETEMEIDLLKSDSPDSWVDRMLVRAAARIPSDNDNMTVLAVFVK